MIGLCGLKMDLAMALFAAGKEEQAQQEYAVARSALESAAGELRQIMAACHPYVAERHPLVDAIDDFLSQIAFIRGIETNRVGEPADDWEAETKTLVYCYLQALITALAQATKVEAIAVEFGEGIVAVTVAPPVSLNGGSPEPPGTADWSWRAARAYALALGASISYSGEPAARFDLALPPHGETR